MPTNGKTKIESLKYRTVIEVELIVKPWERHLPKNKDIANDQTATTQTKKSVAQTKKGAGGLFYTFDRKPYQPKSVNNGKGRKKGIILRCNRFCAFVLMNH